MWRLSGVAPQHDVFVGLLFVVKDEDNVILINNRTLACTVGHTGWSKPGVKCGGPMEIGVSVQFQRWTHCPILVIVICLSPVKTTM